MYHIEVLDLCQTVIMMVLQCRSIMLLCSAIHCDLLLVHVSLLSQYIGVRIVSELITWMCFIFYVLIVT